jgi:hypothetical protein
VVRREGVELPDSYPVFANAAVAEPVFRRLFLSDVLSDPCWFAEILARRAWAILTQAKLAPGARSDDSSIAPQAVPNEGLIDIYYSMTTTVDWLGLGPWRFELPLLLLWGPTLALACLVGARVRTRGAARGRSRPAIAVLTTLAVGGLSLPVLVTTAGGLETETFAVVYFLGFAFLADDALRYACARATGPPAG